MQEDSDYDISLGLDEHEQEWCAKLDFLKEEMCHSQGIAEVPDIQSSLSFEHEFGFERLHDAHIVPDIEGYMSSPTIKLSCMQKKRRIW